VIGIKRWVRDTEDPYAFRAEMSDGLRSPKLECRPMPAYFLREVDLQGMVCEALAGAIRSGAFRQPW
jgi:hypothetical protein